MVSPNHNQTTDGTKTNKQGLLLLPAAVQAATKYVPNVRCSAHRARGRARSPVQNLTTKSTNTTSARTLHRMRLAEGGAPTFTHLLDTESAAEDARRDATCRGKEGGRNPCTCVRSDVSDSCNTARTAKARDNMANSPLGQRARAECKAEGCQSLACALSLCSKLLRLWHQMRCTGFAHCSEALFLSET